MTPVKNRQTFCVELIKPSHYDDNGYVIRWWKAWIPSNSLAVLHGLTLDAAQRNILGPETDFQIAAYDETNTRVPIKKIIQRFKKNNNRGLVCLVGVQSNQFPRTMAIARQFRDAGIQVAMGGFHVSGCLSMIPDLTPELQEAVDLGITLFAGESEGRLEDLLKAADAGEMKPIYNYLKDLPDLQDEPLPFLPKENVRRYARSIGCFDAGRGCPFSCSFCTIINVQGQKSRFRNADDVEEIVRSHIAEGVDTFFITDDNFARNKNWEDIFDRMAHLREVEGLEVYFVMQVDTLCHTIPNFIVKAQRAGCRFVFLGLENINPASLKGVSKNQNRITEYRKMLQAWHSVRVITYCGYILGFPGDTPTTIERDIKIIQKELPVDLLEFFILTPLPGSVDHRELYLKGVWLDPDLNKYDLEHACREFDGISKDELEGIYDRAWHIYYSWDHIETLVRRAAAVNMIVPRLISLIFEFYGSYRFEHLHPLQGGLIRRKSRTQRRPEFKRESIPVYYPKRVWEVVKTYVPAAWFLGKLLLLWWKVHRDPRKKEYIDLATTPVIDKLEEELDMFKVTEAARNSVTKAKEKQQKMKAARESALSKK
ncbi:MAG: radical SAM protein [Verrucomicrobia bacterium]|nr:radical SAM protein [Verrucomicrobiota bacterium]MDA1066044.1 radical SAM protein [Verrucomicrobiota bacterium]